MEPKRMAPEQSRRSVLAGGLRTVALAGLAATGALTMAKRRRLIAEGVCISDGVCNRCAALAQCGLPAALATKDSIQRGNHGRAK